MQPEGVVSDRAQLRFRGAIDTFPLMFVYVASAAAVRLSGRDTVLAVAGVTAVAAGHARADRPGERAVLGDHRHRSRNGHAVAPDRPHPAQQRRATRADDAAAEVADIRSLSPPGAGSGQEPARTGGPESAGHGLAGLIERAHSLGGTVEATPGPDARDS
jgi:hypothetical protein